METRAHHLLIGSFVMLAMMGLAAFFIWVAKVDIDAEYTEYDIYFEGSVAGLYKAGTVFYLGIPVGKITDIALDKDDPRKVQVIIRVRSEVPVLVGSRAVLEVQGLTGVAYIELRGGEPGAPPLMPAEGRERAEIITEFSPFQELLQETPNLVNETILTVASIRRVFDDENAKNFKEILTNTNKLSKDLIVATGKLDYTIGEINEMLDKVDEASLAMDDFATTGKAFFDENGDTLVAEFKATTQSATNLLKRIDGVVAANENAISGFTNGTLPEVSRMIQDLRRAAQSLDIITKKLEESPSGFLFNKGGPEYKPSGDEGSQ